MPYKKIRFTAIERWVGFSVHGKKCYIDSHPIDLLSMQVDHIIPEFLLAEPERLADAGARMLAFIAKS
ncbi:hypothetical protein ATY75_10855 [Rhizobium sp. N122]|uniref:hypothetical protein n=1 Tax=Rhizobium sp. N122 TaxID=1764272 RepID=UPI000B5AB703|nr:hypothetical protein [Rhizobium sp. N122]OWV66097.1 hypothetical protein ATY75_10855 [Rhizobium sp. N122]